MTGLDAIAAHNGWSIALLGISIVFTGLTLLSLTIAQIHKILDFMEERGAYYERLRQKREERAAQKPDICIVLPRDMKESARQFKLLAEHIGTPFALPRLLDSAERCGLARPHSALNDLILAEAIIPDEDGFYKWNEKVAQ